MIKILNNFFLNILLLLLILYCSIFAGWYAAYSNYFFFPIVYELEDIRGHVFEYAPKNTAGKEDFVFVPPGTHLKIFGEILRGVNNDGEGLEDITYTSSNKTKKFLTKDELAHLKDISELIYFLKSFMRLVLVMLLSIGLAMVFGRVRPFYLSSVMWIVGLFSGALALIFKKYGFVKVFYSLHDVIFPAGHKWFFLYEDSLMTTVLKAPDSFLPMGVLLGGCSLIAFIVLYLLMSKLILAFMRR